MASILIMDDEKSMCEFLSIMLKKDGYSVSYATNPKEGLTLVQNGIFDLALIDIRMPVMDGLIVLKEIRKISPETIVIMMTAYASTKAAVQAIKEGAYDYLTKPFKNNDEVRLIIGNALEKKRLKEENVILKRELSTKYRLGNILGKSSQIKEVFSFIQKIANSRSTVLITGESGTGKELVARAIHFQSNQRDEPFVSVNCGGMPEGLLESELFGHVKGAFTGAIINKKGLFEVAHNGTLFLDEIASTPLPLQVKLLRVLQDHEIRRVGSTEAVKVNVRIIAATNKDLAEAVKEGTFREDLFYRLNVIPLRLPPLRERIGDIPILARHFLEVNAVKNGFSEMDTNPSFEIIRILSKYHWPGNVRELENVIERAVALGNQKSLRPEDLPDNILYPIHPAYQPLHFDPKVGIDLEKAVNEMEKDLISQALKKTQGNKSKAAKLLKLSFRSFRYRIQKYNDLLDNDNSVK
ncbi:sigma-54-dependent Fis family transcriptional regulator [bacterium]|nr:sigma-54-dependent Fis family transcriptional regulator [bacterium]